MNDDRLIKKINTREAEGNRMKRGPRKRYGEWSMLGRCVWMGHHGDITVMTTPHEDSCKEE